MCKKTVCLHLPAKKTLVEHKKIVFSPNWRGASAKRKKIALLFVGYGFSFPPKMNLGSAEISDSRNKAGFSIVQKPFDGKSGTVFFCKKIQNKETA